MLVALLMMGDGVLHYGAASLNLVDVIGRGW